MSLSGIRGLIYTLFATILLSTLWVTSLTVLSAPSNATALIADAGADVLNPFLVAHGTGLTHSTYSSLEASAKAHPSQPLSIPLIKVRVLGKEISGMSYSQVVHYVYGRVAQAYYTSGAGAVFEVPPQLQQVLPNFGMFNPDNIPVIPGGPTVSQLPPFMQPFFVFIGLTPDTFTQNGHQRLLDLLPWFWLAAIVLGVLAIVLNPNEKKLAGLAEGVVHSAWPIVAVLVGLWVASGFYAATFAPYKDVMAVVRGAFLPVYGTALVVGLVGVALITWLPALRKRQQAKPAPAVAGMPGMPAGMPSMPGMPGMPGAPVGAPVNQPAAPSFPPASAPVQPPTPDSPA